MGSDVHHIETRNKSMQVAATNQKQLMDEVNMLIVREYCFFS